MSSRIPFRIRQAIVSFPDEPRRGEVTKFCDEHKISVSSFYLIRSVAARNGAEQAVSTKSTAPKHQVARVSTDIEQAALTIRADLSRHGWDAGPLSVASAMRQQGLTPPSRATLARIFTRNGVVTPQPQKKPRAAYQRFVYPDPNGCWQLDGTNYRLDTGYSYCILQVEDDHSRYILASLVATSENSHQVIAVVDQAIRRHGAPTKFLTDNGTALNQSRSGKETRLERFLKSRGVTPISGRPGKPTTQGKNERLHQTLHRFLDAHRPINTAQRLSTLVNQFDEYYNTRRPHQGLHQPDQTPEQAYYARPKALPADHPLNPLTDEPSTEIPPRKQFLNHSIKGATPTGNPDDGRFYTQRRVLGRGHIAICGYLIYIGRRRTGELMHIYFDDHIIEVIDTDGVILGHLTRPTSPTGQKPRYHLTPYET